MLTRGDVLMRGVVSWPIGDDQDRKRLGAREPVQHRQRSQREECNDAERRRRPGAEGRPGGVQSAVERDRSTRPAAAVLVARDRREADTLQHAFEMLLKAVLVERRTKVFDPNSGRSIGFQRALNLVQQELTKLTGGLKIPGLGL